MNVTLTKKGTVAVVAVQGRVDTISAPTLEKMAIEWIGSGETRLILDLSAMDYISSAGLRALFVVGKTAKSRGGSVCCCALQGVVAQVFEVSGFHRMLPVYDSVDAALADTKSDCVSVEPRGTGE
ncbi:MAG: STAS domain-containing protein [Thermodesulfobacteriota bacterium]